MHSLLLGILCSVSIASANLIPISPSFSKPADDKSWDYLMFVQRWPQSVCDSLKKNECEIPAKINDWVVHGLWPNNNDGTWPQFCDKDDKFNVSKVEQFRSRLEQTWPNLERGKTEESLWAHEWEKHGTCAKSLPALADEQKYFSTSLDLFDKYHVGDALATNYVIPSYTQSYTKAQIEVALRTHLGHGSDFFDLACVYGELPSDGITSTENRNKTTKAQLVEVRACVDKQLNLISCPGWKTTLHQRAKRAVFNFFSWITSTSNLPVNLNVFSATTSDNTCPSDEIYIPVFSN